MWWMIISGCVTGYQQAQAERCVEAIRALDEDGDGAVKEELELPEGCEGLDMDELLERYELVPGDCDDEDPGRAPGKKEDLCDDVDQDCDGEVDGVSWYEDEDGDGYGDPDTLYVTCDPPTDWLTDGSDCNDEDPTISPGAEQIGCGPRAVDTDCDGSVDCAVLEEDEGDFIYLGSGKGGVLDGRGGRVIVDSTFGVHFLSDPAPGWLLGMSGVLYGTILESIYVRYLAVWEDGWAGVVVDSDSARFLLQNDGVSVELEGCTNPGEASPHTNKCAGFVYGAGAIGLAGYARFAGEVSVSVVDVGLISPGIEDVSSLYDIGMIIAIDDLDGVSAPSLSLGAADDTLLVAIGIQNYLIDYGLAHLYTSTGTQVAQLSGDSASFGTSVLLMDLDGSGSLDLLVSAPEEDLLYLFLDPTGDLTTSDAAFTFTGTSQTGLSLANAGDINGDGQDDLLVGAEDTAYLFLGGELSDPWEPYATFDGDRGSDLGADLAGADLDQDGYSDLILGAPGDGGVYLLWGGP